MSKTLGVTALVLGLGAGLVGTANATHASKGLDWSLTYSGAVLPDSDPARDTYLLTLGVDTDGYVGNASFLDQISLKTLTPVQNISLVSAPSGVDAWSFSNGGLSAGGCNGHGGGFNCVNSLDSLNGGKGLSLSAGNGVGIDDYSWVFKVTLDSSKDLNKPGIDAFLKARLVDDNGFKTGPLGAGPLNLTQSPVPEPETYAMMLAGLGLIGTAVRRGRRNAM
jgi:hypothetical protein